MKKKVILGFAMAMMSLLIPRQDKQRRGPAGSSGLPRGKETVILV